MASKDTVFYRKSTLNLGGQLFDLQRPWVMGILNLTPDSFYDGNRYNTDKNYLNQVEKMLNEGADLIDIGGQSTRPKATLVEEKEEAKRVLPALEGIVQRFPEAHFSIDTFRSTIARQAVEMGVEIINDISAGSMDSNMFQTVADLKVPYILMHMQGSPKDMQKNPRYDDVLQSVTYFFTEKIAQLKALGVNDILLDPGFGFGKTMEHNFSLLANLEAFRMLELPMVVGISRKSMINQALQIKAVQALNGTTVLNTVALLKGASILRVHDVKQAVEAVELISNLTNY